MIETLENEYDNEYIFLFKNAKKCDRLEKLSEFYMH